MRPTYIEIDLAKIGANLAQVRRLIAPGVKVMGVVKANAYGHGIIEVARYLQNQNIDMLGVAFVQEAILLREAGIIKPILVFYGATYEQIPLFAQHNLEMTVSSYEIAVAVNDSVSSTDSKLKVHIKTDTGMGRIGILYDEAVTLAEKIAQLPNLTLNGVYSHLATSDGSDPEYVAYQLDRFHTVLAGIKKLGIEVEHIHLANSGAVMHYPETHFTIVRPGIMLYGYPPGDKIPDGVNLAPPLCLKSIVGFVKDVGPGVSISYGRRYTTRTHTRIATIPIGYADGYNRLLTNKAHVLILGRRFPVVGTVCMDQIMVDIGIDENISVGEEVVLIGSAGDESVSAQDLGRIIGTIPYEVLCSLSPRVPRIYKT
jgi:alanine racemase